MKHILLPLEDLNGHGSFLSALATVLSPNKQRELDLLYLDLQSRTAALR